MAVVRDTTHYMSNQLSVPISRLVSTNEVAKRLGIHRVNAAALVRSGRLPAVKVGKTWVVASADLERLAKNYVKGPGPQSK